MKHHLISAADLTRDDAVLVLDTAEEMARVADRPIKKLPTLRGRTVVNLFFEDSTRTRISFEAAAKRLSADVINFSAKGSSVSKGESLKDTALTLDTGERTLADEDVLGFLTHCAKENIPVLIHPWDMLGDGRMDRHMLRWLVGMPAETQLSILGLALSGAFEKLPESLKLCFCHGGGSFAYLLGRADNAWHNRDIVRADSPKPPSAYARRFYVDTAVFDPRALRLLVDVMGPDRVMLGTDFPFPLGEQRPGTVVRDCPGLTEAEQAMILGSNAAGFFSTGTGDNDV